MCSSDLGRNPNAIRLALLARHYRDDLMWSNGLLDRAEADLVRLTSALSRTEVAPTGTVVEAMISALANNLDTPSAIQALMKWCDATESGGSGGHSGELSRVIDRYLGLAI